MINTSGFADAAVSEKITAVNAKLAAFGNLTNKTDDDNTAISHLNAVKGHLDDISALFTGSRRSDTSKREIYIYFVHGNYFEKSLQVAINGPI